MMIKTLYLAPWVVVLVLPVQSSTHRVMTVAGAVVNRIFKKSFHIFSIIDDKYKSYKRCQSVLPLWKRDEENPSLQNILVSIEQVCMWITIFYQSVLSLWKRFSRDKKTIFWSLGGWQKMFTLFNHISDGELRQNTLICQAFYCVREEDNKHVMHLSFWAFFLRLV